MPSSALARKHTAAGLLRLVRAYGATTPVDAARSAELLTQIRTYAEALEGAATAATNPIADTPVNFGCHCDLEPGMEPDGCVLDYGRPEDCVHSHSGKVKQREKCEHWKPITVTPVSAIPGAAPAPMARTQ